MQTPRLIERLTPGTAVKCGHRYPIERWCNDAGNEVIITGAYPDPDMSFGNDYCQSCYERMMNKQTRTMTLDDVTRAFSGK